MNAIRDAIVRARLVPGCNGEVRSPRAYRSGGSAQSIDWRLTARRAVVTVRERSREAEVSWCGIVDGSPSMRAGGLRNPFDDAEAAAVAWRACASASDVWLGIHTISELRFVNALGDLQRALPADCAVLCVSDYYDLNQEVYDVLRAFSRCFDCTGLVACDPWAGCLPGGGLRALDAESGRALRLRAGSLEPLRYARAAAAREEATVTYLRDCGWRAARLENGEAEAALARAFGLS